MPRYRQFRRVRRCMGGRVGTARRRVGESVVALDPAKRPLGLSILAAVQRSNISPSSRAAIEQPAAVRGHLGSRSGPKNELREVGRCRAEDGEFVDRLGCRAPATLADDVTRSKHLMSETMTIGVDAAAPATAPTSSGSDRPSSSRAPSYDPSGHWPRGTIALAADPPAIRWNRLRRRLDKLRGP
jgi:hypothetical protein